MGEGTGQIRHVTKRNNNIDLIYFGSLLLGPQILPGSVASGVFLVFQIVHFDAVLDDLPDFGNADLSRVGVFAYFVRFLGRERQVPKRLVRVVVKLMSLAEHDFPFDH